MFPCLSFNHLFWTDFDEIGLLVSIVVVVTLFRSHKDTLLGLVRLVLLSRVFGLAPWRCSVDRTWKVLTVPALFLSLCPIVKVLISFDFSVLLPYIAHQDLPQDLVNKGQDTSCNNLIHHRKPYSRYLFYCNRDPIKGPKLLTWYCIFFLEQKKFVIWKSINDHFIPVDTLNESLPSLFGHTLISLLLFVIETPYTHFP